MRRLVMGLGVVILLAVVASVGALAYSTWNTQQETDRKLRELEEDRDRIRQQLDQQRAAPTVVSQSTPPPAVPRSTTRPVTVIQPVTQPSDDSSQRRQQQALEERLRQQEREAEEQRRRQERQEDELKRQRDAACRAARSAESAAMQRWSGNSSFDNLRAWQAASSTTSAACY